MRVSWIFLSSRLLRGEEGGGAGASLSSSSSLMVGWEMNERIAGPTLVGLL